MSNQRFEELKEEMKVLTLEVAKAREKLEEKKRLHKVAVEEVIRLEFEIWMNERSMPSRCGGCKML